MICDRIKFLREQNNMTQADLAKQLNITRSSVNAWEMGITIPSTQLIVELASLFSVSTDYLLCVEHTATLDISDLEETDVEIIYNLIQHLKSIRNS